MHWIGQSRYLRLNHGASVREATLLHEEKHRNGRERSDPNCVKHLACLAAMTSWRFDSKFCFDRAESQFHDPKQVPAGEWKESSITLSAFLHVCSSLVINIAKRLSRQARSLWEVENMFQPCISPNPNSWLQPPILRVPQPFIKLRSCCPNCPCVTPGKKSLIDQHCCSNVFWVKPVSGSFSPNPLVLTLKLMTGYEKKYNVSEKLGFLCLKTPNPGSSALLSPDSALQCGAWKTRLSPRPEIVLPHCIEIIFAARAKHVNLWRLRWLGAPWNWWSSTLTAETWWNIYLTEHVLLAMQHVAWSEHRQQESWCFEQIEAVGKKETSIAMELSTMQYVSYTNHALLQPVAFTVQGLPPIFYRGDIIVMIWGNFWWVTENNNRHRSSTSKDHCFLFFSAASFRTI